MSMLSGMGELNMLQSFSMKDFLPDNVKPIKTLVIRVLKYTIYAAVIYFVYDKLDGNLSQIRSFDEINWFWVWISILIFAFHSIWNGFNWHYMIQATGENVTKISQMEVYLKSYILRYIPGNVVGILSRGTYNKEYGVPMVKSLWGWFIENIIYLMLGIILGMYATLSLGLTPTQSTGLIAFAVFAGLLVIVKNDLLKLIFEKTLLKKLPEHSQKTFKGLSLSLENSLILTARYMIGWMIYSASFVAIMKALDIDPSNYLIGISVNSMSWAIGYLSIITPSGTGVRESAMILLFTEGVGLANETSVIIALISRVVFIIGEVVGFLGFYLVRFSLGAIGHNVTKSKISS